MSPANHKLPPPGPTKAGWHMTEAAWRCPKEHQYKHVRKIQGFGEIETPHALGLGLCVHAGRARWFSMHFGTDTKTWNSIKDAVAEEAQRQKLPVSLDAERQALALLQEYVNHYSKRPAPKVVAAEYMIGPAPVYPGGPSRTARLDDVSSYPETAYRGLWLGEAKTTSEDISAVHLLYSMHGQTMLQPVLWKRAPQGEPMHGPVAGVMLDVMRKPEGRRKAEFARLPIIITDRMKLWFARDIAPVVLMAEGMRWDDKAPRNPTACIRQYGRKRAQCPFADLCRHGKSASTKYLFENGQSLLSWRPTEGRQTPPWE